MSAISQNQPGIIEIKGLKTSHFKESKAAPQDHADAGPMAQMNVLKVSLQATIYSLHGRGWSRRRIARELTINRETVGRYLLLAKPAISTTGVEGTGDIRPTCQRLRGASDLEANIKISSIFKDAKILPSVCLSENF